MRIYAVAVTAADLAAAVAFYEVLGFRFPPQEDGDLHLEAETAEGVRLMIDHESVIRDLYGEAPRPATAAGFALLLDTPADVDRLAGQVADAGHEVVRPPWDAPWGQRYATVADPAGHRVDLFCPLPA